jgi:single-strand DNA-binding protein
MTDTLTVIGLVATTPRHIVTGDGLKITSFRLASTQRKYDRTAQKWVDGETNWYTITSFRNLAVNVVESVQKGQRVLVTGRLRVRDWATDDNKGTNVEIDAEALGHDLTWGTAVYTRSAAAVVADADADADAEDSFDAASGAAGEQHASTDDDDDDDEGDRPAVLLDEVEPALPF